VSLETGVEWVRLQTSIYRNSKLLNLLALPSGHRTALAYIFSFAYSGEHGCTGVIPKVALPLIQATAADAKRLVTAELWDVDAGSKGWKIHDWDVYQPNPEYIKKLSDAGRTGAKARWAKRAAEMASATPGTPESPPF
jgi:hypothetical protein